MVRIANDLALVQTLDFFPPLVDNPYQFGQIAAANALSDVYAMGGEPYTVMNIVGFPDKELDASVLTEILRGGADKIAEAGALLVGGHSVRDSEVKYGLSVTGRIHPDQLITNSGAKTGDVLVLTKPLGSGVLTTAAKQGKIDEADLEEAICVMAALNKSARDAAVACGVRCGTDITGFGLIGHVAEIAAASGVSVSIEANSVPLLPRTLELARDGVLTRALRGTRDYLGDRLTVSSNVEPALLGVLLDAQTSGGLLLSIVKTRADELVELLKASKAICAEVIGQVHEGGRGSVEVLN